MHRMLFGQPEGLKLRLRAHKARMSTPEPGLDLHEWETEMQALEEDLADSPAETLPELQDLLRRILVERGYAPDDPVASDGDDPEILVTFRSAAETTRAVERGDDVDPGDIASAVNDYRAIYDTLVAERSAP
jgi:hypothetical protein